MKSITEGRSSYIAWFVYLFAVYLGARGSIVGSGTMLQAGRSPVRVPDDVDFLNSPNPSSRTLALGWTYPLTEMCTRNLPAGEKQLARKADNLAAIYEPNVWKCGSLNLLQPQGPWGPLPYPSLFAIFWRTLSISQIIQIKEQWIVKELEGSGLDLF
jgi:hypothetical protein